MKNDRKNSRVHDGKTIRRTDSSESIIARERRLQAALERLGTNDPRCVFCGESNPHVLENHHLAGKAFDDFTGIHCRNCHRKQSNRQKDQPKQTTKIPTLEERVAHFLLGLADFLELLIEKLREFGLALIDAINADLSSPEGSL